MLPHTNPKVSELTERQRWYVLPEHNDRESSMPLGLRTFGHALLEKVPSLKVTQRAANTKLWVYHPHETYMRGWIGTETFDKTLRLGLIRIGSSPATYRITAMVGGMDSSCVTVRS